MLHLLCCKEMTLCYMQVYLFQFLDLGDRLCFHFKIRIVIISKSILSKQITFKVHHKIRNLFQLYNKYLFKISFPCFLILLLSRRELQFKFVHLGVLSTVPSLCLKQTNLFKRDYKWRFYVQKCQYIIHVPMSVNKDETAEPSIQRSQLYLNDVRQK